MEHSSIAYNNVTNLRPRPSCLERQNDRKAEGAQQNAADEDQQGSNAEIVNSYLCRFRHGSHWRMLYSTADSRRPRQRQCHWEKEPHDYWSLSAAMLLQLTVQQLKKALQNYSSGTISYCVIPTRSWCRKRTVKRELRRSRYIYIYI